MSSEHRLKQIVEAALLAAGRPLSLEQLQALYDAQGKDGSDNPSAFPPSVEVSSASAARGRTPGAADAQGRDGSDNPSAFPPSLEVRSASAAKGRTPGAADAQGRDGSDNPSAFPPSLEVSSASAARGRTPGAADEGQVPDKQALREVLEELAADYADRGFELREVGSGFRIQVRSDYAPWVSRLYAERPPKYSRALLETLALIAYRQPITRGEIEDIRGVSVSTNIIKTLTEREWVRVVGHRDVPGKPALYATTKEFLDYFNLKGLGDLPSLAEIRDLDSINRELELKDPDHFPPQSTAAQPDDTPAEAGDSPSNAQEDAPASPDEPSAEADDLIEADPDGETDSGVMHRPPAEEKPPQEAFPEDLADYVSDGETDSAADLTIDDNRQDESADEAK